MTLPKLSSHDAAIIILELEIRGLLRLAFDSPEIAEADNKLLIEARDKRIEVIKQNLIHARKVAG
jgi:hypothetical protein